MKILFTGASSFSGMWFVQELADAGHEITTVFPRRKEEYTDLRRKRVDRVLEISTPVFSCPFGSEAFRKVIESHPQDLFCHHAAHVYDYKNPNFDFTAALADNTKNLHTTLSVLKDKGCQKIILTGSVFEQGEGKGSDDLRAVSPYGLSKGLTSDVFRYFAATLNLKLGKFVIPNPFGPFEEERYTTYLIKSWFEKKEPKVNSPDYVRDNIHISLMAKAYSDFANNLGSTPGFQKINPSGYVEAQGEFTRRFSNEMRQRLSLPCNFIIGVQTEFPEPKIRYNTDPLSTSKLGWNETKAWDNLAEYYLRIYGK